MPEDPWAYYAHLRAQADSKIINDTYWALDEALDEVLDRIAAGRPLPTAQQLDDLVGNRRRKYRDRRRVLVENSAQISLNGIESDAIARVDLLDALTPLSAPESTILIDLAKGKTYQEVAKSMKRPVGSIKIWAHRARKKMES